MPDEENPETTEKVSDANLRYASFSNGLRRYLESVENFFPHAAAQLSLRQHAQHARETEQYLPEEIEMERDELREHLSGILPRVIRGSALVVLYSAFESTVIAFSNDLANDLQRLRFDPSTGNKDDSFLIKANKHFETKFNVQLFSGELEQAHLDILRLLRNSFIHDQSVFTRLPLEIQASIEESKTRLTNCHIYKDVWVPGIQCIKAHGELVQNWARLLGHRVVERMGIDAYL